ncbi:acetyltransferase (GNAT) family [Clostridium pasteurianum DSM 525 = ATCC 6013]|uniref:Acetyltransferase (GNAT) family n=1 Tax=Clostridium pasteurianum DSM 525 = ATCC 6013 TaxID=1262449 RepID=A0A0H3J1I6_CLOPA|nr:GNAT family N-acetyltransferase [Clostridium pasteurianum]AJA47249.1 acetyltransferase (GNAT) family [Clostridium pasteurianum DSM 525 = ATCC 6013]AJA51237.1 acetyltransferase (GNAT) family [Clostridium pasteurianum DSM 525 = ATCC 6013]AOZ74599.1 acetyltransferase [Clostridium pasteurianum DSM 525 = ATCC 6013]AOZ78396.1 acetyltransferase [Clostridium pasteurianum]ELP59368.1 N-acetyltransferase GCN5 [Clostridium pasteurianum DSM 525 = ATCC 6013]
MDITLTKANLKDAENIHKMQVKAFIPLLKKYQDFETNPANESIDKIIERLNQPYTDYYYINLADKIVGAIRIVSLKDNVYRVSPIFVLPEYQNKGIAQKTLKTIEFIYKNASRWKLETILQEKSNCYLYEKLGYKKIGKTQLVNDKLTLVFYEK